MIYVVIGVCGCGKTTVGMALSEKLCVPFRDADEFHSEENKRKMSKEIPLTDQDRYPWLLSIHNYIRSLSTDHNSAVVTCSALKKSYRKILTSGPDQTEEPLQDVVFVHLHGDRDVIQSRLSNRTGHFMPASLLDSQLVTLEIPDKSENCISINVNQSIQDIVSEILQKTNK